MAGGVETHDRDTNGVRHRIGGDSALRAKFARAPQHACERIVFVRCKINYGRAKLDFRKPKSTFMLRISTRTPQNHIWRNAAARRMGFSAKSLILFSNHFEYCRRDRAPALGAARSWPGSA
jgi:hypothetical protein